MSLAALAAVTAALAAVPPPAPPVVDAPSARVPIVVDGRGITRGHLRHWRDVAIRSGAGDRTRTHEMVVAVLISFRWIAGEAADLGIVVTPDEVRASFEEQRDASFKTRRDYRRFLRDSGQTHGNVLARIKHDLLSDKIREHVTVGAKTEEEEQELLDAFIRQFRAKWRARTACLPPWYSESDCGASSGRNP